MIAKRSAPAILRDTSGATAVEFAIIANVFIMFVVGIAYTGIMLFNNASLDWAVDDASRLVTIKPSASQAEIATAINDRLAKFGLSAATVSYAISTVNSIQTAHITASYNQEYAIPFIPQIHLTFKSDAYVPMGA